MTISDEVAHHVRDLRRRRGWTMAQLAERCAEVGAPQITENVLENLEYGRGGKRRAVTVDDLVAFAAAFDVSVDYLLGSGPTDAARRHAADDLLAFAAKLIADLDH